MNGNTNINTAQVKVIADEILGIANSVNGLIGEGGQLSTDLNQVYNAWKGSASDSYKEELTKAQAKFADFYNKIVNFSNQINAAAQTAEAAEKASTVQ